MKHLIYALAALSFLGMPLQIEAQFNVKTPLSQDFDVSPSETVNGVIAAQNLSSTVQTIDLVHTDSTSHNGKNLKDEAGSQEYSNADWIFFQIDNTEVPAGQTALIPYTVEIPPGTPNGSYWSTVQVTNTIDPNKDSAFDIRVAYSKRIITRVLPIEPTIIKVSETDVSTNENSVYFNCTVLNDGKFHSKLSSSLELYDSEGNLIGTVQGGTNTTLPGFTSLFTFDVTDIPAGTYSGLVILDNKAEDYFGFQTEVDLANIHKGK